MPSTKPTTSQYRLARRLLRERDDHHLTSIEAAALSAVVLAYEGNSAISLHDLRVARRLFKALARRIG